MIQQTANVSARSQDYITPPQRAGSAIPNVKDRTATMVVFSELLGHRTLQHTLSIPPPEFTRLSPFWTAESSVMNLPHNEGNQK